MKNKSNNVREYLKTTSKNIWKLELNINTNKIYNETLKIPKKYFKQCKRNFHHKGWTQAFLRNYKADTTQHFFTEGFRSGHNLPWHWSDWAKKYCPEIIKLQRKLSFIGTFQRVSISSVEPGGYMGLHTDDYPGVNAVLNICLSAESAGFEFKQKKIYVQPGDTYQLNTTKLHGVFNDGSISRTHLILMFDPASEQDYINNYLS